MLVLGAIILGMALITVSSLYFIMPASALPEFFPGFDPSSTTHHYKHAIGALLLGVASLSYAWFQSGKKSA